MMRGVDRDALQRLAARRFGLFTRRQALACGYSTYQIRRRLNDGEWQRVLGSTFAAAGVRVTTAILDRAAQMAVPGSTLAGPSAARTYGIPVPDKGQYLYIGRRGSTRVRGVRLLYETPDRRDVQLDQGLPVVCRSLAMVDCLRLLPMSEAITLLDRALQQGWLTMPDLLARTAQRLGRPGAPRLVSLVRLVRSGERASSERLLTRLLRRARITGWVTNVEIRDDLGRVVGVGDVVFERERLVVEIDGWAFHSTPDRFQRDRTRQNQLMGNGWRVLRFTWHDLTQRPDTVIASIRQLLDRA